MNLDDVRTQWKATILEIAARHGARNVRVFGSVARGEATAKSDLDLLADFESDRSLLDVVGFWQDLEDALKCKVDVLTEGGVSPYMKERIYRDAIPL